MARSYTHLVQAAKTQAGRQMTEAWNEPPTTEDAQVSLAAPYRRNEINAARGQCVDAMREALGRRAPRRTPEHIPRGVAGAVTNSADGTSP